ncbi:tRNA-uridine aminocarboxypropyltransferase [Paraglaciecola sp. L3A3]|uniref:tRNA-uridine aminocarboxypropyltransferase n=1 Tax=Paraglaciecola sp. L3A3 TaxID=2686358 RepID=UPI00131AACCB|nr:tRNA-uridine aminocarboxypropyltransferase [Paraglaciecola sp. L3A3]
MQNKQVNKRKHCGSCTYPESTCLCQWIKPISSPIPLIILQHPQEAKHAKNTVKLLQLGLHNIEVLQGENSNDFAQLVNRVGQQPHNFSLCYPNVHSMAIESTLHCSPKASIYNQGHSLIFIDASWRKALKMWHLNPWLHQLDSWHFDQPPTNQYKIRQTKQENSLSTLEAVAYVLSKTQQVNCSPLIQLFLKMQQLSFKNMHNSN